MTDAKKKPVDAKPLDNHATGEELTTLDNHATGGGITTLGDNHATGGEAKLLDNHATGEPQTRSDPTGERPRRRGGGAVAAAARPRTTRAGPEPSGSGPARCRGCQ